MERSLDDRYYTTQHLNIYNNEIENKGNRIEETDDRKELENLKYHAKEKHKQMKTVRIAHEIYQINNDAALLNLTLSAGHYCINILVIVRFSCFAFVWIVRLVESNLALNGVWASTNSVIASSVEVEPSDSSPAVLILLWRVTKPGVTAGGGL